MNLLFDYTFQTVALGSLLLGIVSGIVGSFAVLRKQALLGDGISHAALSGVAAAFLLTGSRSTEILLLGALCSGLLAAFLIVKAVHHTRLRFDAALASVMSVLFGLGTVLLTCAQKLPNANQAGLSRFIYGQASAMTREDIIFMLVCCGVLLLMVIMLWKELKVFVFDRQYAAQLGFNCGLIDLLLSLMTVITIMTGLQTVGVILMSAMLAAPAAAARQWTDRLPVMVALAAAFGGICGVAGTYISSITEKLPTGPAIVLCISAAAAVSLLFAPKRGVLSKLIALHKIRALHKSR